MTYTATGNPATLASGSSSAIRDEFTLIETELGGYPAVADMNMAQYATDASASGALYVLTTNEDLGSYVEGMSVWFEAAYTNSGTTLVKVNGGASVAINDYAGTGIAAGVITAGDMVTLTKTAGAGFQVITLGQLAASEAATAADVVTTNADVVLTNADVVSTGNDVTATNADVVTTNADVVLTNADVALTNADVVTTNADVVTCAGHVTDSAANAALAATNIATIGTSTTSNSIGTGAKTFTVESSKEFAIGMELKVADDAAPTTNYMIGIATTSFTGDGSLGITIQTAVGSGTKSAWTITTATAGTPEIILNDNTVGKIPVSSLTGDFVTYYRTGNAPLMDNLVMGLYAANDVFIALDYGNSTTTLQTSADGITWTDRTSTLTQGWCYACWTGTKYVISSTVGTEDVDSSTDLATWATKTTVGASGTVTGLVSDGAGTVVRTNNTGAQSEFSTDDGDTWGSCTTSVTCTAKTGVFYVGSNFIAVDGAGALIWHSADGDTWSSYTTVGEMETPEASWQMPDGSLVIKNTVEEYFTSSTGLTSSWTSLGFGPTDTTGDLTKINDVYVFFKRLIPATVSNETPSILTSTDFVTWVERTTQGAAVERAGPYRGNATLTDGTTIFQSPEQPDGGSGVSYVKHGILNLSSEGIFR